MKHPEAPWLDLAIKEIGTKEWPGAATNPVVAQYYADAAGHKQPDSVPWCAAFAGAMIKRAGYEPWNNLMARGALPWGTKLDGPVPGAIVVFPRGRPPQGHVAIVESVGQGWVDVVGGNQSDMVKRERFRTGQGRVLGYRWPPGAPLPGRKAMRMEVHMADWTPQQIADKARELYSEVDRVGYDVAALKKMAKETISLSFYLAKLSMSPAERKGIKFGPLKVKPKPKARKKAR